MPNQWELHPGVATLAFPNPIIVSSHPQYCGCAWGWAPSISTVPGMPFVLKYPARNCNRRHYREYRP